MQLITPDFGLLFWMSLVFLVVLFILWKWGFPAIVKMVNDRKAYIDDSLRKAHEANERLTNIKIESESILQEAREKQALILKEAAATRDAIVEQAQEKARAEGNRLISEAQVAELSVKVAEKVLRKQLDNNEKQMDFIDRMLDEVCTSDKK